MFFNHPLILCTGAPILSALRGTASSDIRGDFIRGVLAEEVMDDKIRAHIVSGAAFCLSLMTRQS